jgi:hypothetical protein
VRTGVCDGQRGWPGGAADDEGGVQHDVFRGGSAAVEPFGSGLDGELGHPGNVLAVGGEVDEGQVGEAAVVVPDHRYVGGYLDFHSDEGVDQAQGAPIIAGDDSGG